MKLVLLVFLCVSTYAQMWPFPGPGTVDHSGGSSSPSFVQGKICNLSSSHTTNDCAFTSSIASGHLIVGIFRYDSSTNPKLISMSSSAGVACTWSTLTGVYPGNNPPQAMASFYCFAPSGGAETVRATLNEATGYSDLLIAEYSGVTALDTAAVSNGSATNATPCTAGPTGTLTGTGRLIVGYCGLWDSTQTWANTGSFNYQSGVSGANNTLALFGYVSGSTSAVTFSYSTTSDKFTSLVAAFKP